MIVHDGRRLALDFFSRKPVHVEAVEEHLSSDAGLLLFRQWDEEWGFTAGFAAQLDDSRRDPEHALLEMVRSRLFGILAGYEDQNDHDLLRSDALFKLLAGRLPDEDDLASQPTLSRFENSVSPRSLLRLEEWFLERFVASFDEPPPEITLDIDVFDDPTHGQQQLTFFHGYYGQYPYLVRVRRRATDRPASRLGEAPRLSFSAPPRPRAVRPTPPPPRAWRAAPIASGGSPPPGLRLS